MMTKEEATMICNAMWQELDTTDPQRGADQVIRNLVKIAQNKTSPLAAVEAAEILYALDPETWAQGPTQSAIRAYRAQQQNEGKENA
jgi:hypothetical protein